VTATARKRGTAGLALLLITSCGTSRAAERTVDVFAAASLREAFTAVAAAFEAAHPGTRVRLSVAGSQVLAAQVRQGAPAEVLATADVESIEGLVPYRVLARNQLAVVGPAVRSLSDLARPGLRVVLAAPEVPAGRASRAALGAAGVVVHPVSLEDSVAGVVTKVRLGEADGGIAYVTDLRSGLPGAPVPGASTQLAIGAVSEEGRAFVAFALGPDGQRLLRQHGFS